MMNFKNTIIEWCNIKQSLYNIYKDTDGAIVMNLEIKKKCYDYTDEYIRLLILKSYPPAVIDGGTV